MNDNLSYQSGQPKTLSVKIFLVLLALAGFAALILLLPPKVMSKSPNSGVNNAPLSGKISTTFDLPLRRTALSYNISPKVDGTLTYSDLILKSHLARTVVYTPNANLAPDTDYTVTISGIESYYNPFSKSGTLSYKFHTEKLPSISKANLADGQKDVQTCDPVKLTLDGPNQNLVDFNFSFAPVVEFTSTLSSDSLEYTIAPTNCFAQGTEYILTADRVVKSGSGDALKYQFKFTTAAAPDIKSYSPAGDAVTIDSTKWSVEFAVPMNTDDTSSKISITPATAGQWSWQGKTIINFTAAAKLKYDTKYDIVIPKGTKDDGQGFTSADIHLTFKTIGPVVATAFSPANNAVNIPVDAAASVTFNQAVDKTSANAKIHFSPAVDLTYAWEGNKVTLTPKTALGKSSSYKIIVDAGVKSIAGEDSILSYQSVFNTVEDKVQLNIAQHYQEKALSCEAASLEMALSYRGLSTTETNIMDIVGFDPTAHVGNVWGDPNSAFVGDINGKQDSSGYGVYWGPIAKAANYYRPGSAAFTGGSVTTLTDALSAGNPIVIWGTFGASAYADSWQTPSGTTISAWKGEHARLVTGFAGNPADPTTFYLNDPVAGKITWTKAELLANWGRFNNSGVIVK